MIGPDGLLWLVELVRTLRAAHGLQPESECSPCPSDRSTWHPPPNVAPELPLWRQLPAPARRRLLELLSQMLERQLGRAPAPGKEGCHDGTPPGA
jgi:hypothetical protein